MIAAPQKAQSRPVVESVLVVLSIAAIGWIDYATGQDVSFALIYMVPIAIAAWWASPSAAWVAVIVSSVAWIAADLAWSTVPFGITLWNAATRWVIFGSAVLAIHHVRDTRERERLDAIEALRVSEARYRGLVESTSDLVWEVDADQRYVYASPKSIEVLGYTPEELIGRRPDELMPPGEAERVRDEVNRLASAGKPLLRFENVNRHKDGHEVVLETSALPLLGPAGEFRGYRGIDRDITERKHAEAERLRLTEQLHHAQRAEAIGRLAGGVAHEFNNMLTVILGSAECLLDTLKPGDPSRADVGEIRKAGERARQLTRQLLTFGRRQVLEPKPIDLNTVLLGMEGLLRRLIPEDIRLATTLVPGVAAVNADPAQVEQVVMTLSANARDAMVTGGTLSIRTAFTTIDPASPLPLKPGPYVTLSVQDTSGGMDAAAQAQAFEPFVGTGDLAGGAGLGLAVVRSIAEQSGGHVQLDSAPGRGTTFTVYLPRLDADTVLVRPRPAASRGTQRASVLVVEDEATVRALLVRFLESDGYAVVTAASPADALRVAGQAGLSIDLLVTDVVMPGMNGPSLAATLTSSRPGLRVLYVSGYPEAAFGQQGNAEPNAALLQKPFSREALSAKVREVLA